MVFEALVIIGITLTIFLALLALYLDKESDYRNARAYYSAYETAGQVARAVNHVLQAGNATSTTVQLKQNLETGENYTLGVIGRRVEVAFENRTAGALVLTNNFSNADVLSPGKTIKITNVNGVISFEQA